MHERTTPERERTLPTVAASAAARTDGRVHAVRFEAVPEQLSLSSATDVDDADRTFESRTEAPAAELPAEIRPREIVAHDLPRAVVNDAPEVAADLLVGGWEPERTHAELLGATSTDP